MGLMSNTAGAQRVQQILNTFGCLPAMNPVTSLPEFNPLELAQAIERNLNEAAIYGHTKLTLHLDLPDAHALARCLRGA
jgi:hypothetical protein